MGEDQQQGQARLAAIVLAAGSASRFGSPKQLVSIGELSLVAAAVRAAAQVADAGVWAVIGAGAPALEAALGDEPVRLVLNPDWPTGMASSLRCGVDAVTGSADAVLLMLADQPGVTGAELARLVDAWRASPGQPAAAVANGRPCAPAIFPASDFEALRALSGDQGARSLLRDGRAFASVNMPAAAVDIDTPADLQRFVLESRLSGRSDKG